MEGTTISDLMINEQIRDKEVRLIGEDGEQLGIVSVKEAMRLAEEAGLDLVKIAPTAKPPVCKIVDYGKFKYEQLRKEKEAKKKQLLDLQNSLIKTSLILLSLMSVTEVLQKKIATGEKSLIIFLLLHKSV